MLYVEQKGVRQQKKTGLKTINSEHKNNTTPQNTKIRQSLALSLNPTTKDCVLRRAVKISLVSQCRQQVATCVVNGELSQSITACLARQSCVKIYLATISTLSQVVGITVLKNIYIYV